MDVLYHIWRIIIISQGMSRKSKKTWADVLLQCFGFMASFVKQKRDCLLIVGSGNPLFLFVLFQNNIFCRQKYKSIQFEFKKIVLQVDQFNQLRYFFTDTDFATSMMMTASE